jgi:hypothetical protein
LEFVLNSIFSKPRAGFDGSSVFLTTMEPDATS